MKKIAISIPTPCHENWQNMNPTEQGRFCLSCKKEVIDFSAMTDGEIVHYLKKRKGETCGSFLPEQLDHSIIVPKESSFSWKYFFQILLPAFLFSQKPQAQNLSPSILKTSAYNPSPNDVVIVVGGMVAIKRPDKIIKGIIIDSLTGGRIPFTTIKIKESNTSVSADSTGFFSIRIKNHDKYVTLIITSIGYQAKELSINSLNQFQTIELVAEKKMMEDIVVHGYATTKVTVGEYAICTKRTYFHKIKDTLLGDNSFTIYPNPVSKNSFVNIDMKGVQKGEFLLQLTDVQGKMEQQEKIEVPDTKFNFQLGLKNELASGIYFLRIINPDNKLVYTGKIVME
jgi:hypothetical protein